MLSPRIAWRKTVTVFRGRRWQAVTASPTAAAVVARISARLIISWHTVPSAALPGQRTMKGTLNPPSQIWCLPPRRSPLTTKPASMALVCGVSFCVGRSHTPPLSLLKRTRVSLNSFAVEHLQNAAHGAVEFVNPVAKNPGRALPGEVRFRRHRIVHRDRLKIEEERLILRHLLDPFHRLVGQLRHHLLVLAPRHVDLENLPAPRPPSVSAAS